MKIVEISKKNFRGKTISEKCLTVYKYLFDCL